eukprot:3027957-Prymnesium_polylepis.1
MPPCAPLKSNESPCAPRTCGSPPIEATGPRGLEGGGAEGGVEGRIEEAMVGGGTIGVVRAVTTTEQPRRQPVKCSWGGWWLSPQRSRPGTRPACCSYREPRKHRWKPAADREQPAYSAE